MSESDRAQVSLSECQALKEPAVLPRNKSGRSRLGLPGEAGAAGGPESKRGGPFLQEGTRRAPRKPVAFAEVIASPGPYVLRLCYCRFECRLSF